jgi:hypothetical protein
MSPCRFSRLTPGLPLVGNLQCVRETGAPAAVLRIAEHGPRCTETRNVFMVDVQFSLRWTIRAPGRTSRFRGPDRTRHPGCA